MKTLFKIVSITLLVSFAAPSCGMDSGNATSEAVAPAATSMTARLVSYAHDGWNTLKNSSFRSKGLDAWYSTCNGFKGAYNALPSLNQAQTNANNGLARMAEYFKQIYSAINTENVNACYTTVKETLAAHPYATGGTVATIALVGATYGAYKARQAAKDKARLEDYLKNMAAEKKSAPLNRGDAVRSRSKFELLQNKLNSRR